MTRWILPFVSIWLCFTIMLAVFAYPNKPYFSISQYVVWLAEYFEEHPFPSLSYISEFMTETSDNVFQWKDVANFFQGVGLILKWIAEVHFYIIGFIFQMISVFFKEMFEIVWYGNNTVL